MLRRTLSAMVARELIKGMIEGCSSNRLETIRKKHRVIKKRDQKFDEFLDDLIQRSLEDPTTYAS